MDQLSSVNDILISPLGLMPLVLAAGVVLLIRCYRSSLSLSSFEVSTRTYAIVMVLAAGVLAILCSFLRFNVLPPGGSDYYFPRALNIVRFGSYDFGTRPDAKFPPGYSFLMVPAAFLLGDSPWVFLLTNVVLLVGASIAVCIFLRKAGLPAGLANLIALLLALYPNRFLSTLLPFSDIPFSLVYLCAFMLMILSTQRPERALYPIGAGLAAGAAALVRATGLPLIIPLMLGVYWLPAGVPSSVQNVPIRRFRMRNVLLLGVATALVLLPWTVRNAVLFGKVIPVSNNFGLNLAIGNNPGAGVTLNGYIDSLARDPVEWRRMGGDSTWNGAQVDSFLRQKGIEYIQDRPALFLVRGVGKVFHTIASDASTFGMHQTYDNLSTSIYRLTQLLKLGPSATAVSYAMYATAYRFLFVVNNTFYYSIFALTFIFLYQNRGRWTGPEIAYIAAIVITCALPFVLFGSSRFKEPIPPLTLVLLALQAKPRHAPELLSYSNSIAMNI